MDTGTRNRARTARTERIASDGGGDTERMANDDRGDAVPEAERARPATDDEEREKKETPKKKKGGSGCEAGARDDSARKRDGGNQADH